MVSIYRGTGGPIGEGNTHENIHSKKCFRDERIYVCNMCIIICTYGSPRAFWRVREGGVFVFVEMPVADLPSEKLMNVLGVPIVVLEDRGIRFDLHISLHVCTIPEIRTESDHVLSWQRIDDSSSRTLFRSSSHKLCTY